MGIGISEMVPKFPGVRGNQHTEANCCWNQPQLAVWRSIAEMTPAFPSTSSILYSQKVRGTQLANGRVVDNSVEHKGMGLGLGDDTLIPSTEGYGSGSGALAVTS